MTENLRVGGSIPPLATIPTSVYTGHMGYVPPTASIGNNLQEPATREVWDEPVEVSESVIDQAGCRIIGPLRTGWRLTVRWGRP